MAVNLSQMSTETRNPNTMNLDEMSCLEIVTAMNREDAHVPEIIHEVLPQIASAAEMVASALKQGGRLFYLGAGTSGRLALADAAECPPTFGVSPDRIIGLIAGGPGAYVKAAEGAEDSFELSVEDLKAHDLCSQDVVIGIAASGRTPYVLGGLDYARSLGCKTAAIACNRPSKIGQAADIAIEAVPGPEVLTGSTRLKAGTTQKLILNMISTAAMVQLGKVYQNLMVDMLPTNEKLLSRAEKIVVEATGVSHEEAASALKEADGVVKTAIVMILASSSAEEARIRLEKADGRVRRAIEG